MKHGGFSGVCGSCVQVVVLFVYALGSGEVILVVILNGLQYSCGS